MDLPAVSQVPTNTTVVEVELLSNDGRVLIDGLAFDNYNIEAIEALGDKSRERVIAIQSAQQVKLQALITLLDRLADAGLSKVALVE